MQRQWVKKDLVTWLDRESFYGACLTAVQDNLQSSGWGLKAEQQKLNTLLGAWILLRHDVAAYAKQSYTSLLRALFVGPKEEPRVPRIYVAPAPATFRQLARSLAVLLPALQAAGETNLQAEVIKQRT